MSLEEEVICGQPDPIEALELHVLALDNGRLQIVVENVGEREVRAGVYWVAFSEKNEVKGEVCLGVLGAGDVAAWEENLSNLPLDLTEHLGAGELVLRPCSQTGTRCRQSSVPTQLYFLASHGTVSLGEGIVPPFASAAGESLARESGLLDDVGEAGEHGEANLTVRVVKKSDSVDYKPPTDDDGEGGAP